MNILALDIGKRRTGAAYANKEIGIPLPLTTIQHTAVAELSSAVLALCEKYTIHTVVIGLPVLLSGEEGEQARFVRQCAEEIAFPEEMAISFLDERYTTPRIKESDPDSAAACEILSSFLQREKG